MREMKRFLLAVQDGFGLFLIALALFAVATNTQTGWLFLPSAFILVALAAHIWAARALVGPKMLASFLVEGTSLEPIRAGQRQTLQLHSRQRTGLASLIDLELEFTNTIKGRCQLIQLSQGQPTVCQTIALKRGQYKVLSAELTCYRPLGWISLYRKVEVECSVPILVGPQRIELDLPGLITRISNSSSGLQRHLGAAQTKMADSGDFERLREYSSGDDTRLIHWLSSARSGTLVVRQASQIESNPQGLAIFLDLAQDVEQPGAEQAFEQLISYSASVFDQWSKIGPVRLFCNAPTGWTEVAVSESYWAQVQSRVEQHSSKLSQSLEIETLEDGRIVLEDVPQRLLLTTRTSQSSSNPSETVIVVGSELGTVIQ